MCYAHLQTCARCSWLINITYPRCSHAKAYYLEPTACPMRMERRHAAEGMCQVCRVHECEALRCGEGWARKEGGEKQGVGVEREQRRSTRGVKRGREYVNVGGEVVEESGDEDEEYMLSSTVEEGDSGSDVSNSDDGTPTRRTRSTRATRSRSVKAPPAHSQPRGPRARTPARRRPRSPLTIAQIIEQEATQRKRRFRRH